MEFVFLLLLFITFTHWTSSAGVEDWAYFSGDTSRRRPRWTGIQDVTIEYDTATPYHNYKLKATVIPCTTPDHKTPDTYNGVTVGMGEGGISTGYDGGHLLAFELGGPNSRHNIVPQPSAWQQYGTWRTQFEAKVYEFCKECYGWTAPNDADIISQAQLSTQSATHTPESLCNIEIDINSYQNDPKNGNAQNDGKIPSVYQGELECVGKNNWKKICQIEQPMGAVFDTNSRYEWKDVEAGYDIPIIDPIAINNYHHLSALYMEEITVGMIGIIVLVIGCLPGFMCGMMTIIFGMAYHKGKKENVDSL